MIEINLVPDVKQELIRAQRVRSTVISSAILVGIAALALVVVLSIWVFGVQTARGVISDNTIKDQSQKLSSVSDISNTLTIQNQLDLSPKLHDSKHINSRTFEMLTAIRPLQPNEVDISKLAVDTANSTITITAQAANGYPALDVFKKTIAATNFEYVKDGTSQSVALASNMSDSDRSYGEDVSGKKVLRFTLTFTYPAELFAHGLDNARSIGPVRTNATDSYLGVPQTLFTPKASDPQGEE